MRTKQDIKQIIIHCSASGPKTKFEDIRAYHKRVKGWKDIGYHYVIEYDGQLRTGRPWQQVGAHVEGHNHDSIGVCLVGGLDGKGKLTKFSDSQIETLKGIIGGLQMSFGKLDIYGHRHYNKSKSCPNFDVEKWLETKEIEYLKE